MVNGACVQILGRVGGVDVLGVQAVEKSSNSSFGQASPCKEVVARVEAMEGKSIPEGRLEDLAECK